MRRKISATVDGGLSGGSFVRRPGSEDPISASGNFSHLINYLWSDQSSTGNEVGFQVCKNGFGLLLYFLRLVVINNWFQLWSNIFAFGVGQMV